MLDGPLDDEGTGFLSPYRQLTDVLADTRIVWFLPAI